MSDIKFPAPRAPGAPRPQGALEKVLEGVFAAVDSLAATNLKLERVVAQLEARVEKLERDAK